MERILIADLHEHVGKTVTLAGWVHIRRDHGKLIFIDFRDTSGKVQMVALPNHTEAHSIAGTLRSEWVVEVEGVVNTRPEKMVNSEEENGDIEIEITKLSVLNESETPPFDLTEDSAAVDETLRLKYRYLDLRTSRLQQNLKIRSQFLSKVREYLHSQLFTEIETPLLSAATAEGARDFVVPSRLHPGEFYALPQSPQQYKQLLMAAGFERYYQLARALRDEDLRADRGFEHTQIDIEMSFVNQEHVMQLVENMVIYAAEALGYTFKDKPFPRLTYQEAIATHGDDKFDLRTETEKKAGILAYAWVIDFPFFEKTDEGTWTFTHNPFSMPKEEFIDDVLQGTNTEQILTTQYDLVGNGFECGGGSIRSHRADILEAVYNTMGYSEQETKASIGHMLEAFRYGTPPHGGIALGVERNVMNLTGEDALRDVQAFPMTRGGQTAVMNAPKNLPPDQLTALGISVLRSKK